MPGVDGMLSTKDQKSSMQCSGQLPTAALLQEETAEQALQIEAAQEFKAQLQQLQDTIKKQVGLEAVSVRFSLYCLCTCHKLGVSAWSPAFKDVTAACLAYNRCRHALLPMGQD